MESRGKRKVRLKLQFTQLCDFSDFDMTVMRCNEPRRPNTSPGFTKQSKLLVCKHKNMVVLLWPYDDNVSFNPLFCTSYIEVMSLHQNHTETIERLGRSCFNYHPRSWTNSTHTPFDSLPAPCYPGQGQAHHQKRSLQRVCSSLPQPHPAAVRVITDHWESSSQ